MRMLILLSVAALAACGPSTIETACRPTENAEGLAARKSPYDSVQIAVGGATAQLCYSRPSAAGRTVFGGLVPYDTLWRTGANEPTILHLPVPATIAGLPVQPGHYSLYTVPSLGGWTLVVNGSTTQWGLTADLPQSDGSVIPNSYTAEVRAQEVGRAPVAADSADFTETLTFASVPAGLELRWERTKVTIPIAAADTAAAN